MASTLSLCAPREVTDDGPQQKTTSTSPSPLGDRIGRVLQIVSAAGPLCRADPVGGPGGARHIGASEGDPGALVGRLRAAGVDPQLPPEDGPHLRSRIRAPLAAGTRPHERAEE